MWIVLIHLTEMIDDLKLFPWFANYPRSTWTIYHMTEDAKYSEWPERSGDTDDAAELLIVYCLIEEWRVLNCNCCPQICVSLAGVNS